MISYNILQPLKNPNNFAQVIYNNFKYLKNPSLNHNINEINRLLTDNNFMGIILQDNNKIVGYLVGEYKTLDDGRFVYYITYMYISKSYRGKKLSTMLLQKIKEIVKTKYIILTCANNLVNFYEKHGYSNDLTIPSYTNTNVNVLCLYV